MSINIQAKTNYSFLFSGLSSSASNALSGNWLADYASIKNGSYGKLMKAYYAKDSGDSKTAASTITKKDTDRYCEEGAGEGRDHDRCSEGVRRCIVSDR